MSVRPYQPPVERRRPQCEQVVAGRDNGGPWAGELVAVCLPQDCPGCCRGDDEVPRNQQESARTATVVEPESYVPDAAGPALRADGGMCQIRPGRAGAIGPGHAVGTAKVDGGEPERDWGRHLARSLIARSLIARGGSVSDIPVAVTSRDRDSEQAPYWGHGGERRIRALFGGA